MVASVVSGGNRLATALVDLSVSSSLSFGVLRGSCICPKRGL